MALFFAPYCSSCTSQKKIRLEYKIIGYSDASTFVAVVLSPIVRVAVAESLNHNIGMVREGQ